MSLAPVIRYPGSKARIAAWIVSHFPRHDAYLEPFFGSGTVLFAKPRGPSEIAGDLDGEITNLFRVMRDQPDALARAVALTPWSREEFRLAFDRNQGDDLERARRFIVYWWQAVGCRGKSATGLCIDYHGKVKPARSVTWINLPDRILAVAERLQGVQFENRPALDLIARCRDKNVLIYADPPYPASVRRGRLYECEMQTDEEHVALLQALRSHPGPVVLSGYENRLYGEMLAEWTIVSRRAMDQKSNAKTELLWLNPVAAAALPLTLLTEAR